MQRYHIEKQTQSTVYKLHSKQLIKISTINKLQNFKFSLEELPVDNVGCFSNASFSWIRKYRISQECLDSLPIYDGNSNICQNLPKSTYTDSCRVNAKRYVYVQLIKLF